MSYLCCGYSLRSGVKTIAVIGMVGTALVCLIALFVTLINVTIPNLHGRSDEFWKNDRQLKSLETTTNAAGTLLGLFFACGVGLNYILYIGAKETNATRCNVWYYVTLVSVTIASFGSFGTLAYGQAGAKVLIGIWLIIQAYILTVVRSFIKSIEEY